MKRYNLFSIVATLFLLGTTITSCNGDLDVTPIDPNVTDPNEVLSQESTYLGLLAKCYSALAVSSSDGPDSDPDIKGIDGGFGQYMRALFYMQELPTDEAVIGWNDQTVKDLHGLAWTSSDVFITAMYARIYYQISLCNELIREAKAKNMTSDNMKKYIAEARAIRALAYLHAIDIFGNVGFSSEDDPVNATYQVPRIARADLYTWLVSEVNDFMGDLGDARTMAYGRIDKGFAKMLLAKLYLNAEVYTGGTVKAYDKCADVCKEIMQLYPVLNPNYANLFLADNNNCTDEIIFAVQQDGINIKSYGCTNFIIFAEAGGSMDTKKLLGISSGWGGIRCTPNLVNLYTTADKRNMFYTDGQTKDIDNIGDYTNGYPSIKFKNLNSDGSAAQAQGFVDTDFPLFRSADAYLMYAEAKMRAAGVTTSSAADVLAAFNAVHQRAGLDAVTSLSLDELLNERGRELVWECWRRSDLVRFGKFTTADYLWQWKGGVKEGKSVDSHFNLMPIPATDLNTNRNLKQNTGY